MQPSRYVMIEATSAAEAFNCASGVVSFTAKPRLVHQPTSSTAEVVDTLGELTVLNTSAREVRVGDLLVARQDISGFWILWSEVYAANAIKVTLTTTLLSSDPSSDGVYKGIASVAPFTGDPEDIGEADVVNFDNPYKLDAMCDSVVLLKREATISEESPENQHCQEQRWVIVEAERKKARFIKFRYPAESLLDHWYGEDPTECNALDVEYPLGEPCADSDVLAFYDPVTDTYQAMSTPSAMLGPSEAMNIVQAMAFDGCGINYTVQQARVFPCGSDPSLIEIEPELTPVNVLSSAGLQDTQSNCPDPCTYTWNEGTSEWDLTAPCSGESSGCDCGPAPSEPPGVWNDNSTTYDAPCTSTSTTGLSFTAAVVYVCATEPLSPTVIPITDECPPEEYL